MSGSLKDARNVVRNMSRHSIPSNIVHVNRFNASIAHSKKIMCYIEKKYSSGIGMNRYVVVDIEEIYRERYECG
jgi:hypothetical protein